MKFPVIEQLLGLPGRHNSTCHYRDTFAGIVDAIESTPRRLFNYATEQFQGSKLERVAVDLLLPGTDYDRFNPFDSYHLIDLENCVNNNNHNVHLATTYNNQE